MSIHKDDILQRLDYLHMVIMFSENDQERLDAINEKLELLDDLFKMGAA